MCGGGEGGGHHSIHHSIWYEWSLGAKRDRERKPDRQEFQRHTKEMHGDPRAVGATWSGLFSKQPGGYDMNGQVLRDRKSGD